MIFFAVAYDNIVFNFIRMGSRFFVDKSLLHRDNEEKELYKFDFLRVDLNCIKLIHKCLAVGRKFKKLFVVVERLFNCESLKN